MRHPAGTQGNMKHRFALWFYAGVTRILHWVSAFADSCAFRTGRRAAHANLRLLNLSSTDR